MKLLNTTVEVPAGTYQLGDPCYTVPDDAWMPLLESCGYFEDSPIGTLPDGTKVLGFSTQYGDGSYRDNRGNSYGVDAGMIGLVPVPDDTPLGPRNDGMVVKFNKPTVCHRNPNGTLQFGNIVIKTGYDDESKEEFASWK